jgi:hypothetical protein
LPTPGNDATEKGSHVIALIVRTLRLSALALVGCWLVAAGAQAEGQTPVDDAKLDSIVVAAQAVHQVIEGAATKINDVKTDEEANELRAEIDAQVEEAIEQTDGITLAEYKEIHQAAQQDPELENRIIERFNATTTQ